MFKNEVVGLAFRQDKLYKLSMHENVNVICNDESVVCKEKCSSSTNVSSKRKRCDDATSAKLWHYRLGHISRGRIEIKHTVFHIFSFLRKNCKNSLAS
jgi:hypothetical protein